MQLYSLSVKLYKVFVIKIESLNDFFDHILCAVAGLNAFLQFTFVCECVYICVCMYTHI